MSWVPSGIEQITQDEQRTLAKCPIAPRKPDRQCNREQNPKAKRVKAWLSVKASLNALWARSGGFIASLEAIIMPPMQLDSLLR